MSLNLDKPSVAAADAIGLFRTYDGLHGHPTEGDSWARAVVAKIEAGRWTPASHGPASFGTGPSYSSEEWAVWDWYRKQTEPERWKELVTEYRETGSTDRIKPPAEFDPANATITKPGVVVEGSDIKPFAGKDATSGSVAVSTEAILHFANALSVVAPPDGRGGMLVRVIDSLDGVSPRPGAFAKAEVLRRDIMGTSASTGLRGETAAVMVDIQAALVSVQTDLRALAKDYDSTEELNSLSVDKFGDVMRGSDARIDRLGTQVTKDKDLTGD